VGRPFQQVDVFSSEPQGGNPVAVVLDGDGLDDAAMLRFTRWTNLSEATFVLPPRVSGADYRVRIFTPSGELPFAGHPTLGTCHAWLGAGGKPTRHDVIVQECPFGLVPVRRDAERLSFAAPALGRSGAVAAPLLAELVDCLGLAAADVVEARWATNGPQWIALLLADVETVLAVKPGSCYHDIGLVALRPPGSETACEVRAFFPKDGGLAEDPVTGSLNAAIAQWFALEEKVCPTWPARAPRSGAPGGSTSTGTTPA
jgi:PhzF family phenazine biosynthesis protein